MMFTKLPAYYTERAAIIENYIKEMKISTDDADKLTEHKVIKGKLDEINAVKELVDRIHVMDKTQTVYEDDAIGNTLKKAITDHFASTLSSHPRSIFSNIECTKKLIDLARAASSGTADISQTGQYATIISHLENEVQYVADWDQRMKTAKSALKWYGVAYTSCQTGELTV